MASAQPPVPVIREARICRKVASGRRLAVLLNQTYRGITVMALAPKHCQRNTNRLFAVLLTCAALLQSSALPAETVTVRHIEGLMLGFLALRTLEGKILADGEMTQVAQGESLYGFPRSSLPCPYTSFLWGLHRGPRISPPNG